MEGPAEVIYGMLNSSTSYASIDGPVSGSQVKDEGKPLTDEIMVRGELRTF